MSVRVLVRACACTRVLVRAALPRRYIGASHSMQIIRDTLAAASTALDKVAAAHGKQTRASL